MSALSYSDLSVTVMSRRNLSNEKKNLVKLTLGDGSKTYPGAGTGIALPTSALAAGALFGLSAPLRALEPVQNVDLTTGRRWVFDPATNALRAYGVGHIPAIVYEELPTLAGTTTKTGTLKYKPAYIFSACATVSAAIVPLKIFPSTATAVAGSVVMNMSTGAFTSYAETPTLITFGYIPQQGSGAFSAANMVIEEVITQGTGSAVNLANRAGAIQTIYQTASTAAYLPIGHTAGSNVVSVDIVTSGNTAITTNHSNNNGKAAVVTYLKYAGFQNPAFEWIDQATYTLTTEVLTFGTDAGVTRKNGIYIPGFGNQLIVFHDSSTYDKAHITGATGTPAAGLTTYDITTGILTTAETSDGETLTDLPLMFLGSLFTPPVESELTVNQAPASTTLYFNAIA